MDTPVAEDIEEEIRLDSFGERIHTVVLHKNQLLFNSTKISLTAVSHFKFGIKVIQFGMFPVGRRYQIDLKSPEQEFSLVFKAYLGFGNKYFNRLFERLVDGIWLRIGDRLFREAVALILGDKTFTTGRCTVSRQGVTLNQDTPLAKKQHLVPWNELGYEKKYNRLVINSKVNHRIWANLYFLDDWNVDVLMDVLDWLFKEGGLAELQNNTDQE